MKKTRVLVFPCGSEIGLEIQQALRFDKTIELVGASSVDSHGRVVFENYDEQLPFISDPGFIEALNALIARWDVDFIFPAYDDVLMALSHSRDKINATLLVPEDALCQTARLKSATYQALHDTGICPATYAQAQEVETWPVFAKPDQGQGSQGVAKITDAAQFDAFQAKNPGHIFCEFLPGEEFTVDCFTDRHGQTLFVGPRRRLRVKSGIAVKSEPVQEKAPFLEIAEKITSRMAFRGAWFFQVKYDRNGALKLLEVAPRIAGTMGLSRALGANLPLMTVLDRQEIDLTAVTHAAPCFVDRALSSRFFLDYDYSHVFVDFDDTLILGEHVNIEVMAFLYHARNAGKEIVMLTRHAHDLAQTMERLAIAPGLFDRIEHITDGTPKSAYMADVRGVFIDDAFSERRDVAENTDVITFNPDAVGTLIDWRVAGTFGR